MMIWIYRLFFPIFFGLGIPYYLLHMVRRGGYGATLAGRFGWIRVPPVVPGRRRIWLQAVSVGELLAIEGLIKRLADQPEIEVILSTTTSTGFQLALQKYGDQVLAVVPFPLDFWPVIAMAWRRIRPDLCVITEVELWPEHLHTASRRGVPLLLINARLSDKSYRRMKRARALQSLFYQRIHHIAAASSLDAERILDLGFPQERLTVTGNLKFDVVDDIALSDQQRDALAASIWQRDPPEGPVFTIIGASTWPGEEKLLVDAVLALHQRHGIAARLLLTPRHAERRAELRSLLEGYGEQLCWCFRTRPDWASVTAVQGAPEVQVADTTGELKNLIQLADVAVIGRSFPPHTEGQTPIEAAALGVPVVYGPCLSNFRAICRALEAEGGALRVTEPDALLPALEELWRDAAKRVSLSQSGKAVLEHSRGSTERTFKLIAAHF